MNPVLKVLIATLLVCFGLYFGVSKFLGTTKGQTDTLDLKSLAYIRPESSEDKPKPEQTPEILPEPREAEEIVPEPDEEARIDVTTVVGSDEDTDEASEETPDEDAEATDAPQDKENILKEALGISEPPLPVRAVDVALEIPSECEVGDIVLAPLAVKYRHESPSIKGFSLSELELLVAEYRKCGSGIFYLSHNPLGKEDATPALKQRRLDELKYFFLQHRVPKAALRFPEIHD